MPRCQICNKECEKVYPSKMEKWTDGELKEFKKNLCKECLEFWVKEDFHEFGVYSRTYPQGVIDDEV